MAQELALAERLLAQPPLEELPPRAASSATISQASHVDAFADLRVQEVHAFADDPGEWEIVTAFPDFTIQKVHAFGDFKIRYVQAFPGKEDR